MSLLEPLPSSFRFENRGVTTFNVSAFENTTLFDGFKVPINSDTLEDDSAFMYAKLPKGLFWYDRYGKAFLTDTTTKSGLKEKSKDVYDWETHFHTYYNDLKTFKYPADIARIANWQGASVRDSIGPRAGEAEAFPA